MKTFFTDSRREMISRTLFDTWKITFPAALASGLLVQYNWFVRMVSAAGLMLLFIVAVIAFPADKEKPERNK